MQPMQFRICSGGQFEDAFENSFWGENAKCNQCDFASHQLGNLRMHMKIHSGKNQTNVTYVIIHALIQVR